MKRAFVWTFPALLVALGIGLGLFTAPADAQQKNVLVAGSIGQIDDQYLDATRFVDTEKEPRSASGRTGRGRT